jgi:hypothetical protein
MPSYPHRFQPGDTVTIRAWDDILSQYGSFSGELGIKTPYIIFSDSMKQYCGRSFKVKHVWPSINDKYWIYKLDCCYFPFTEDMFVFAPPVPASTISFDDLMKGAT